MVYNYEDPVYLINRVDFDLKNSDNECMLKNVSLQGELEILIVKEDDCFVAYCSALDLSTHGDTLEEAKRHLFEVIDIFLEETSQKGTLEKALQECGWWKIENDGSTWTPPAYVAREHISLNKHLSANV